MGNSKFFQSALAFGLAFAVSAPSVYAAGERGGGGAAGVDRFKDQIRQETNLSQSDINAIEPQLSEFAQRDADPETVAGLAKTAVDNNCTGPCLRDVLASMSAAMDRGVSEDDAQDMVSQALRDQVAARAGEITDPSELGSDIRASVDARLAARTGAEAPGKTPGAIGGGATGGY